MFTWQVSTKTGIPSLFPDPMTPPSAIVSSIIMHLAISISNPQRCAVLHGVEFTCGDKLHIHQINLPNCPPSIDLSRPLGRFLGSDHTAKFPMLSMSTYVLAATTGYREKDWCSKKKTLGTKTTGVARPTPGTRPFKA